MSDRSYYAPKGGLPPQTQILTDRAMFTEAYAVIPKGTFSDIVTSYLPFWDKARFWVIARPLSGFAETFSQYIAEVLPGGVLQVQGAREIRANDETQYMVISGLVRAQDVASDNSVESTQLADSKVEYYGKGQLADKQRQGWLSRLLDNIWPF